MPSQPPRHHQYNDKYFLVERSTCIAESWLHPRALDSSLNSPTFLPPGLGMRQLSNQAILDLLQYTGMNYGTSM